MTLIQAVMEDQASANESIPDATLLLESPRDFAEATVGAADAGCADPETFASDYAQALRARIGDERFDLWFEGKARFTLAGNTLVVEVPHAFAVKWILA